MRDRLVELLLKSDPLHERDLDDDLVDGEIEAIADQLLSEGVIVPPCKVGDTVWFIRNNYKVEIIETTVEKIVLKHGGLYIKLGCNSMYETACTSIGKTVFLTREEAEQALAERSENGKS